MIYRFIVIFLASQDKSSINLAMQHSKWVSAGAHHIPTSMLDNKANLLSHILAPPTGSAKRVLQATSKNFVVVIELYFALPERPVHERVPLLQND
jgi:hypothetical protein